MISTMWIILESKHSVWNQVIMQHCFDSDLLPYRNTWGEKTKHIPDIYRWSAAWIHCHMFCFVCLSIYLFFVIQCLFLFLALKLGSKEDLLCNCCPNNIFNTKSLLFFPLILFFMRLHHNITCEKRVDLWRGFLYLFLYWLHPHLDISSHMTTGGVVVIVVVVKAS